MVEVRLGCREDRADFHVGYCRARLHGRFDQCGRRPKRGAVTCGVHGSGHAVRQREGSRLSPQEAGRLSGLARRIKRDGAADLTVIPSLLPALRARIEALKKTPALLQLRDDVTTLTALREVLIDGSIDMEVADLTRLLAVITAAKAQAVRTMTIEGQSVVPVEEFQRTIRVFIEFFKKYVPIERHAELLEEIRLSTRYDEPVGAG